MITTNLDNLASEIAEVANEFSKEIDLTLNAAFNGDKMSVEVVFADKTYNYSYDLKYENELERKRYVKRYVKLSAYKTLCDHYGEKMPWGALTGIRPTKLAYQQGENWRDFFINDMLVSADKTELVGKILDAQKPYMVKAGGVNDLFVSIPFCPTRCAYCSFLSCEIGREKHVNEYIAALINEIEAAKRLGLNYRSIYVGGGTPVSIETPLLKTVLDALSDIKTQEFTVEAGRPDCITEEKLKLLKDHGVTRVCVNPQTFSDKTLSVIGRKHSVKDVIEKYELTKSFGFTVNMDLIAGLPEETFEDFKYSIDKAIELYPENVTVHTLCLKKGSKLKESVERLSAGEVDKMVDYAHAALFSAGYVPYYLYRQKYMAGNLENTGYERNDTACIYNIDIMEEIGSIVACGANGVSKRVFGDENRIERLAAPKDILTYLNKINLIISDKNELFA
ncbi:MAG: coproporphyrinogen dehydrogenase HemZ [Clostridia bacterium]|nr:coproporphyrinogen dehydrogenase HemZ [Clostridia bacterium]